MNAPSRSQLIDAIADATRGAATDLFRRYRDHRFYYLSLITTGEALAPRLTAWSYEALAAEAQAQGCPSLELKWSYADSPFYRCGESHFARVEELFRARPQADPENAVQWRAEYQLRVDAMEAAIARLDAEGTFGRGAERLGIVINVEVIPPDSTNTARAKRLNPAEALKEWLIETAE